MNYDQFGSSIIYSKGKLSVFECQKTKTKVITLDNHNRCYEPIKIQSKIYITGVKCRKIHCPVPAKIHTHPMEGHRKCLGGGGLKSQHFRSKYKANLEFPGGIGDAKQKTLHGVEYGYFLELCNLKQVTIGYASHWLRNWHKLCHAITEYSKGKPKQT